MSSVSHQHWILLKHASTRYCVMFWCQYNIIKYLLLFDPLSTYIQILTLITLNGSISLIAWLAFTDHSPHWHGVQNPAVCICPTRFSSIAWIHTFPSNTSCLRWAVIVLLAPLFFSCNGKFLV